MITTEAKDWPISQDDLVCSLTSLVRVDWLYTNSRFLKKARYLKLIQKILQNSGRHDNDVYHHHND